MASPCTGICTLSADKVCVGCFRTSHEIFQWRGLDSAGRREVLALCSEREERDAQSG
ncbi:DUF1289 domain-containing protein [Porticoccaceae bacterium]|nr:DUF1289 domain-containing protein [Porticoccaceae bacterium]